MYKARHEILGLEGDSIKADIPETYKLQSVSNFFVQTHGTIDKGWSLWSILVCLKDFS